MINFSKLLLSYVQSLVFTLVHLWAGELVHPLGTSIWQEDGHTVRVREEVGRKRVQHRVFSSARPIHAEQPGRYQSV